MHDSIFMAPLTGQDETRLTWLYIDATENSLVERNLEEMWAVVIPPLSHDNWEVR